MSSAGFISSTVSDIACDVKFSTRIEKEPQKFIQRPQKTKAAGTALHPWPHLPWAESDRRCRPGSWGLGFAEFSLSAPPRPQKPAVLRAQQRNPKKGRFSRLQANPNSVVLLGLSLRQIPPCCCGFHDQIGCYCFFIRFLRRNK